MYVNFELITDKLQGDSTTSCPIKAEMDPFLIPVMIKGHDAMARRDDPQKSPP
jgi:hypothetical protein